MMKRSDNGNCENGKHHGVELSFGVAIGVNALLSKKLGEKDFQAVSRAAGQGFLLIGAALYETIPALLLRVFSATDEMLAIGVPAFRIIGVTLLISGMTIMMSGVFQAMNSSGRALSVSIVQAVSLVGCAALLSLTGSVILVWLAFPISELIIFVLSVLFLWDIVRRHLPDERAQNVPVVRNQEEVGILRSGC